MYMVACCCRRVQRRWTARCTHWATFAPVRPGLRICARMPEVTSVCLQPA